MAYKRPKKNYRIKVGGAGGYGGIYKFSRDPMAPYRKFSEPESQYSRNLKDKTLRDELNGPSGFLSREPSYKSRHQPYVESGMTRSEINELVTRSLKGALEKHVESTGVKPVPTEMVEVASDTAHRVAESFNKNEVQQEETIGMSELLEQNEIRQEQVREKTAEMNHVDTEEQLDKVSSEIKDINSEFFGQMDRLEPDTSPNQEQQRRTQYDSEVGY